MKYRTLYLGADVQYGYRFYNKRAMVNHDCGVKASLTISESRYRFGIKRFHLYSGGGENRMPGWVIRELEDYCLNIFPSGVTVKDWMIVEKATDMLTRYFFEYHPLNYCHEPVNSILYLEDGYDRIRFLVDGI